MRISQLIYQNLKKNLKNYYLYVFALMFSAALYFAFVTLQYDPATNEAQSGVKGAAGVRAGSVLLIAIVTVFLLYANNLFIKRRSKEIGLFQLIGMTKNRIFWMLGAENFILYFGSLMLGIFAGFSMSKLIKMVFFNITSVEEAATLEFSMPAFIQTVIVFCAIYVLILLMNYLFIKRQTILALFRVVSMAESRVKKLSLFEIIIGILGMVCIALGYYVSSKLFSGDFTTLNELLLAMLFILASVILGTYLVYKGSVSVIFNFIRKKKNGYLNVNEVLSLTSIMFRMKSNALLLTVITTVSALALGLLSLSYISYYSTEKSAANNVPAHFTLADTQAATEFTAELDANHIDFQKQQIDVVQMQANITDITDMDPDNSIGDLNAQTIPVVSEKAVEGIDLAEDETKFTGYNDIMQKFMPLKNSGRIEWKGENETVSQSYRGLNKEFILSWYFTSGGIPVAIVDDTVFHRFKNDQKADIQKDSSVYIGINMENEDNIERANDIFHEMGLHENGPNHSRLDMITSQKNTYGMIMFIVGFLGLTFLITSGCILYFKQMDESEEEKPNYTILRKLGYSQGDLLKGIKAKQLFTFGIPLVIGLAHSYFAVQSGWFMFGTELWTPMIIVMVLYAVLYSVFGILSVVYCRKVIREALL